MDQGTGIAGHSAMDTSPYAIEQMANGSFVVMKIVQRTQAALPGRNVTLNAYRGSFATREEAEREIRRLVGARQTIAEQVS
jgi:hypothetical protein